MHWVTQCARWTVILPGRLGRPGSIEGSLDRTTQDYTGRPGSRLVGVRVITSRVRVRVQMQSCIICGEEACRNRASG